MHTFNKFLIDIGCLFKQPIVVYVAVSIAMFPIFYGCCDQKQKAFSPEADITETTTLNLSQYGLDTIEYKTISIEGQEYIAYKGHGGRWGLCPKLQNLDK